MTLSLYNLLIPFSRFSIRSRRVANRTGRRAIALVSLLTFAVATLAVHVTTLFLLEESRPGIRDPEYARRVRHLRARVAENPDRPLVVIVGSSRTALGICPAEWERCRSAMPHQRDPLLFNMSSFGSGPILQLIVTRRLLADNIRPAAILFEFWPPLLSDDQEVGFNRIPIDRLYALDRDVVNDYFPNSESVEREMTSRRLNPIYSSRHRLLSQIVPRWLPTKSRVDWMWEDIDEWGWKPGCDFKPGLTPERTTLLGQGQKVFEQFFSRYSIGSREDQAIREAVTVARDRGVAVALIHMPESSEFRGFYPPDIEKTSREYLAKLSSEMGIGVIDARTWIDDGLFSDGFHLSRLGAEEFTRRFGPTVSEVFPTLKEHP